jgi:PKD repeat protein
LIAWDYSLSSTDADILRQVAKAVVYDSLTNWNVGKYDPVAGFNSNIVSGLEYEFQDASIYSDSVSWNFGDGTTANGNYVTHTYPADGTYLVTQIVTYCQYSDTAYYSLTINTTSVLEKDKANIHIYPNPGNGTFIVTAPNTTEYSIFNAIGQAVCSGLFKPGEQTLNLADPAPGIYFLKTDNSTYRLVISKP